MQKLRDIVFKSKQGNPVQLNEHGVKIRKIKFKLKLAPGGFWYVLYLFAVLIFVIDVLVGRVKFI